jgi:hypothetical protein
MAYAVLHLLNERPSAPRACVYTSCLPYNTHPHTPTHTRARAHTHTYTPTHTLTQIAFFDIGDSRDESRLWLPSDISTGLFPRTYSLGGWVRCPPPHHHLGYCHRMPLQLPLTLL